MDMQLNSLEDFGHSGECLGNTGSSQDLAKLEVGRAFIAEKAPSS